MYTDRLEVSDFKLKADCLYASAGNFNGAPGYHRLDESSLTAPVIARGAVYFPTIIIGGKYRIVRMLVYCPLDLGL